jgi:hypothetical protein
MKKDQGKEQVAEHRNGHRNPNSPRLTAFESNEEIEREIRKPKKTVKKKKAASAETGKIKKKKRPGKGGIDPKAN